MKETPISIPAVTPKAYSYLRFSTPEQSKGDSHRRQTTMAEAYALRYGLDLDTSLTFQDLGMSAHHGLNVRVGRLGEFLALVSQGAVPTGSFLLVESLDRMSRDHAFDAQQVLSSICLAGITVVTLADDKAYSAEILRRDPFKLIEAVLIMIRANEESATKARRGKASWEGKRLTMGDKPLTARAPAWLTLDREQGCFQIIPERATVVSRIYQLHGEGVGQNSIAETLNREQVPTFGKSLLWHRSYVAKILDNPAVMGRLTPHTLNYEGGKKVRKPLQHMDDYFPEVISPEVYARVQAGRLDNRTPHHREGIKGISSLFAGLARCPKCNGTMTRVAKGKRSRPALVCVRAKAGAGCEYRSVRQDIIEDTFIEHAPAMTAKVPSGDNSLDSTLDGLEDTISDLEYYIRATAEAVIVNPRSTVLSEKLRRAEDDLEARKEEYREAQARAATMSGPLLESKLKALREELQAQPLNRPQINVIMRQLFSSVVIDYNQGVLALQWKQGGATEIMYHFPES